MVGFTLQVTFREQYRKGSLDDRKVTIEVPANRAPMGGGLDGPNGLAMQEMILRVDKLIPRGRGEKREMKISEARPLIEDVEVERLINADMVRQATLGII